MSSKLNVIQSQIKNRESVMHNKDQDRFRQALRQKRDEALEDERRAAVKQRLKEKLLEQRAVEHEKKLKQENIQKKKQYDRLLMDVEKTMNEELKEVTRSKTVEKERVKKIREVQTKIWNKQFDGGFEDPVAVKRTMKSMNRYVKSHLSNLIEMERKEANLIEQLKNTQA